MKKEVRKCAVCGKKFTPKSANAAYCSDKCYKVAKAKKDKARKAAKKLAKVLPKKILKSAKKAVKAELVQKVKLPRPQKMHLIKVAIKEPTVHVIKPGDVIKFNGFTPERVLSYAARLAAMAILNGIKPPKKGK